MAEPRGLIIVPNIPPPVGCDGPPSPPPAYDDGPGHGSYAPTPRPTIGDAEYRMAMDVVAASVRMLRLLPVAELRDVVSHAETVGPILEPTAYMRGGGDNLRDQSELLAAVAALIAVAERIEARAGVRRG